MLRTIAVRLLVLGLGAPVLAQVPAPFPRPGQAAPRPQQPGSSPPPQTATAPQQPAPTAAPAPADAGEPTEAMLGAPIYPSSQYIESYDAGHGQRFYIYGSASDFVQVSAFYRTMLKQKGELIFEEPPVQMFELGRFREETMGFPPSVTVKDYAWGGAEGYLNPKREGAPARFKTIIQIVPAPAGSPK